MFGETWRVLSKKMPLFFNHIDSIMSNMIEKSVIRDSSHLIHV